MIAARAGLVVLAAAIAVVAALRARDARRLEEAKREPAAEAPAGGAAAEKPPDAVAGPAEPAKSGAESPARSGPILRLGRGSANEILRSYRTLPPEDAAAQLIAAWGSIKSPRERANLLRQLAMLRPPDPHILAFLDLGMNDPELLVRMNATSLLRMFAFADFEGDPGGYESWKSRMKGLPVDEVLRIGAAEFVAGSSRLRFENWSEFSDIFGVIRNDSPGFEALKAAGMCEASARWLQDASLTGDARGFALGVFCSLDPDDDALRRHALPLIGEPDCTWRVLCALQGKQHAWSADVVLPYLKSDDPTLVFGAMCTLSSWEDPKHVPALMEAIFAAKTQKDLDDLTYSNIQSLTGVNHQNGRTVEWWRNWWKENEARFREAAPK